MEALGCNVAWGMIDAFFYLLNSLGQRGHSVALLGQLRRTSDPVEARRIVADELPPLVASLLEPHEIESLRGKLAQIPESTVWLRLAEEDWLGALGVFLLVFLSLFPVVVPFIFVSNVGLALRISNGVALVLLFLAGCSFGRFAHSNPWRAGFAMVILGVAVVGAAINVLHGKPYLPRQAEGGGLGRHKSAGTTVCHGIDRAAARDRPVVCRRTAHEGNRWVAQPKRKDRGIPQASHHGRLQPEK